MHPPLVAKARCTSRCSDCRHTAGRLSGGAPHNAFYVFIHLLIHSFIHLRCAHPKCCAHAGQINRRSCPRVQPGRPKRRRKNLLRSDNVCLFVQRRWIIIAGCGFSPHRGALLFHLRKSFSLETASARQAIKACLFPPVCSEEICNPGGEGELQVLEA